MNSTAPTIKNNPLSSFMRQPKIYIRLPSNGQFWPSGSLELTETGEFPVFSMTAQDELLIQVPDALMNGQAVVDVIQNCVPNIKNAWYTPSIDMEIILIAIRIATYGHIMTTPITVGNDVEMEYTVDLRNLLDDLMNSITWEPVISINDDLTVYIKPINYKQVTELAIRSFETQKLMQIANNDEMSEEDKVSIFKESFKKLTGVTIGLVSSSVYKIDSTEGFTEDSSHIKEFFNNVDREVFNKIEQHLEKLKNQNAIKPIVIQVTDDMREQGITGDTIEVPLTFDASSFFA